MSTTTAAGEATALTEEGESEEGVAGADEGDPMGLDMLTAKTSLHRTIHLFGLHYLRQRKAQLSSIRALLQEICSLNIP